MFNKIRNYFKREAFIRMAHVHYSEDGELKRKNDAFTITVCQYGKCHSHFGEIPWEDVNKVLDALKSTKGKLILSVSVGMGESNIMIPKWAKKTLIDELEKELKLSVESN